MPQVDDPLLGQTLDGRYHLHEKLGEGGMGAVYRATHTLMGKPCAIKVLRGPMAVQELAGKRFQREAQSASRLDHEHCIRVSDFGRTSDGISFLVMELLEGKSLAEELGTLGALPVARVLGIARQVAEALEHAHGLGVVHRDLKPDNIMLLERGATGDFVKVLDFGLAKLLESGRPVGGSSLSTLSEVGSVFGTPEYMSPEQAEGRPLDARADLYSFGVLLYQMMTGQLPFQAASFIAVLTKHMTETPVSPALRRPDLPLPPELVDLCLRCLRKDADKRPQTATEIIAAIDAVEVKPRVSVRVAAHPTVELGQAAAVEVPEAPARRRAWLWGVVALPVVAIAVVAMVALREPAAPTSEVPKPAPTVAEGKSASPPPSPTANPSPIANPIPSPSPIPIPSPIPKADPDPGPAPDLASAPARPEPVAAAAAVAPSAAFVHLREAAKFRKAGNPLKELYHLQEAVKASPGNREALYRLGAALIDTGQRERGCEKLAKAGNIAQSLRESSGCGTIGGH